MPDDTLYRTDIVTWSRQQAERLPQAIVHALKITRWPESPSVAHWYAEALTLLDQAQDRHRPSMAREIDIGHRFARARRAVLAMTYEGPSRPVPESTRLSLAMAMDPAADLRALVDALGGRPAG